MYKKINILLLSLSILPLGLTHPMSRFGKVLYPVMMRSAGTRSYITSNLSLTNPVIRSAAFRLSQPRNKRANIHNKSACLPVQSGNFLLNYKSIVGQNCLQKMRHFGFICHACPISISSGECKSDNIPIKIASIDNGPIVQIASADDINLWCKYKESNGLNGPYKPIDRKESWEIANAIKKYNIVEEFAGKSMLLSELEKSLNKKLYPYGISIASHNTFLIVQHIETLKWGIIHIITYNKYDHFQNSSKCKEIFRYKENN